MAKNGSSRRIETRRGGRPNYNQEQETPTSNKKAKLFNLKCEQCSKRFANVVKFNNHMFSHKPKEEARPGEMLLDESWYADNLVLEPQNTEAEGEFIVDSLYLTKDRKLHCYSRGQTCFLTGNIKEMIQHRELLHPLLEQRFSHEVWSKIVPDDLDDNDSNNNDSVTSDLNTSASEEAPHDQSMRQTWIQALMGI